VIARLFIPWKARRMRRVRAGHPALSHVNNAVKGDGEGALSWRAKKV